ncbi:unnamed protein product [Brachionus calyciflorus]|uniref:Uncharacterized protein n=1 Tax=Brachionus calyciflorus TaxID=104777 RepID=A0A814KNI4_9BILA|nr:unnamed protein product [Brachionus calyciflorus]
MFLFFFIIWNFSIFNVQLAIHQDLYKLDDLNDINSTLYYNICLNNLSHLKEDTFNNISLNYLEIYQSNLKNISEFTFRGIKDLKCIRLIDVRNPEAILNQNTFNYIGNKLETIILSNIEQNQINLNKLFKLVDTMLLKDVILKKLYLPSLNIDVSNNSNLKHLTFQQSGIEIFRIKLNKNMTLIDLNNNNINQIVIEITNDENRLESINLNKNKLTQLSFPYLPYLIYLNLNSNNFQSTKYLNKNECPNLIELSMIGNKLESIENLNSLNKLEKLYLSMNFLNESTKFQNLSILELKLNKNLYKNVIYDNFLNLENLLILDLSHNLIEYIQLNLSGLQILDLSYNRIKFFDAKHLFNLIKIDISYNFIVELSNLSLSEVNSISQVFLGNNKIKILNYDTLNFLNFTSEFNLMHNSIEILPIFPQIENLISLSLPFNLIVTIEVNTFSNLFNLKYLDLSDNLIHFINSNSFINLNNLNLLNLNRNYLSEIPKIENMKDLDTLYLKNQNGFLKNIRNRAFERINAESYLEIYLNENNFTFYEPHSFCSRGNTKLNLISFQNLNLPNLCMLKQFLNLNLTLIIDKKLDCQLIKMSNELKIFIMNFETGFCDNKRKKIENNCDDYVNFKFNCLSNLEDFERKTIWYFKSNFSFFPRENITSCFQNRYFKILGEVNLNSHVIRIKFCTNDKNCVDFDNENFFMGQKVLLTFSVIFSSNKKVIFYHNKTKSLILIKTINGNLFIGIRAYKYIFDESNGLLISKGVDDQDFKTDNDENNSEELNITLNKIKIFKEFDLNIEDDYFQFNINHFGNLMEKNEIFVNDNMRSNGVKIKFINILKLNLSIFGFSYFLFNYSDL